MREGEIYEIHHAVSRNRLQLQGHDQVILSPHSASKWYLSRQGGNTFKIMPADRKQFLDTRGSHDTFLSHSDVAPGAHRYENQLWHFRCVDPTNMLWRIDHPANMGQIAAPLSSINHYNVILRPLTDQYSDHASLWYLVPVGVMPGIPFFPPLPFNPAMLYQEFTHLYDAYTAPDHTNMPEDKERLKMIAKALMEAKKSRGFIIPIELRQSW